MIQRSLCKKRVEEGLSSYPITLILGPRQCGKTTLAREICKQRKGTYLDLEDFRVPIQPENASLFLDSLEGLVVIDEIQLQPYLFQVLRVLADRRPQKATFLILGSAAPHLVKGASESLAGRVHLVQMTGFSLQTEVTQQEALWLRGGFPDSFLSESETKSLQWRQNFIQTYLERDIPQLGLSIPAASLGRFWSMLAHCHAQQWNASFLARAMGHSPSVSQRYLDILTGSYLVRQLQPWFVNKGKRVVKSPKVYIRDSGVFHALLEIKSKRELWNRVELGFSWEGFAVEQILEWTQTRVPYFYKTHSGAELDLMIEKGGHRYGFEFKCQDAPRSTKSMHQVVEELELTHLWVIYPGEQRYPLTDQISVVPLSQLYPILEKEKIAHKIS